MFFGSVALKQPYDEMAGKIDVDLLLFLGKKWVICATLGDMFLKNREVETGLKC